MLQGGGWTLSDAVGAFGEGARDAEHPRAEKWNLARPKEAATLTSGYSGSVKLATSVNLPP